MAFITPLSDAIMNMIPNAIAQKPINSNPLSLVSSSEQPIASIIYDKRNCVPT